MSILVRLQVGGLHHRESGLSFDPKYRRYRPLRIKKIEYLAMVDRIDRSQMGPRPLDRQSDASASGRPDETVPSDSGGDRPGKSRRRRDAKPARSRALSSASRPYAKAVRNNSSRQRSYAAIDLGTNNCRLLIARPSRDGFIVVDAFSRIVRLGEGLAATGRISDRSMDRAVAALAICADKLQRRNVTIARSVATEACRRASNGHVFLERVARETGILLDVISAEEEARLAVLGCHVLLEPGAGPALVFDIGGGSTELVLVEQDGPVPTIIDWQSIPWGVVSLTESAMGDLSTHEGRVAVYEEMRALVTKAIEPFARRLPDVGDFTPRLLGTSGTVTTLASLHLDLPAYDRKQIDGLIVPSDSMRDISQMLAEKSVAERIELPCIGRDRADLVVAGCAILEGILDIWPATQLGVADRGIREGILRSLMASDQIMQRRS